MNLFKKKLELPSLAYELPKNINDSEKTKIEGKYGVLGNEKLEKIIKDELGDDDDER